ncbi:acylase [Sphingomonas sp. SUN039]|uniref:penicillin acylase family protein n=1 Tax=Sphingomonas sp. SUN039 TaxID=2937787 RepID=UPI0028692361|nr:acylase [Sphingomonas sp. SUN039]
MLKRIGLGLLVLVALLAVAALVWEPLSVTAAAPPPARSYDAQIVRDEFGVPHIYGKTDADAAYGLAYAHAEDDFSTLQEVVAMTRGRTGAMIGADGAKVDYVRALLDVPGTVSRHYAEIPADVRAVLDGYATGLNRYADKHPGEVRLSKLFPVNGQDIAAGFVLRSPFFFGLDGTIGALNDGKDAPRGTAQPMSATDTAALTPYGRDPSMNGSNAFAVSPKKMADGRTWLISNSHQPYEGGVAWYEANVHSEQGLDMAGALFPGSPFVLLGHNRNLGWTNTVNGPDLIDVYKLVLGEDKKSYRYDGKWLPLEQRTVWLPVKFGPFTVPVPKTVYRAVQGPVVVNKNGAFAIRYAAQDSVKNLEQYFRIQKAQDWSQWTQAMSLGGIPATNFIYADKTGRIAFVYNALFPQRAPGFDYRGVLPGDTSRDVWNANIGFAAMPKVVDPASGWVFNANNTPFTTAGPGSELDPKSFSPMLGIERRTTNRITRAIELLSAEKGPITPERLLAIKFDTAYSRASFAGPWIEKLLAADLKSEPDLQRAQALLRTWDWNSDGNAPADALGEAMMHMANRAAYNGEKSPDPRAKLREVVDALMKGFGRIDPPLGDVQRLQRGKVDLPANGGTDTLRAATTWEPQKDGRMRVKHGDSFIMLIAWDKAGKVESRSVQPYGAATTRPDSPHYTDQMKLFEARQFKPVHFERADVLAHAKRTYRP